MFCHAWCAFPNTTTRVELLFSVRCHQFRILVQQLLYSFVPAPIETAKRRGLTSNSDTTIAQVLKTYYSPQGGKLSLVRVWQGEITDSMILNGVRIGGMYRLMGQKIESLQLAKTGEIVALSRMEGMHTGDTLTTEAGEKTQLPKPFNNAVDIRQC